MFIKHMLVNMPYSTLFLFFICLPFLLYACREDFSHMEVQDHVWWVMLLPSIPFIIYNLAYGTDYPLWLLLSCVSGLIMGSSLFYLGAIGGADAKMIFVLSFILASPGVVFGMVLLALICMVCLKSMLLKDRYLPFVPMLTVALFIMVFV